MVDLNFCSRRRIILAISSRVSLLRTAVCTGTSCVWFGGSVADDRIEIVQWTGPIDHSGLAADDVGLCESEGFEVVVSLLGNECDEC